MASEMVERVAMAIFSDSSGSMEHQLYLRDMARAAIAAMKEPTEVMIDAGRSVVGEILLGPPKPAYLFPDLQEYKDQGHVWQAMCDAALKE